MNIPFDKTFPWVPLFLHCDLDLECLTHFLKNLILLITFEQWLLELWYFTMSIANGKSFPLFFEFVTLTLEFVLLFKKFNLAYNFRKVSARAFIFYWVLLVARPFRVYQHFLPFDLGVWPNLWKLLTLLKTLEQWVLQLWYYTWVFYETRPHHGYWKFWPYDLDLVVNLLFENVNFVNNIWIVSVRALISYISIYSNRSGPWKRTFLSLWPWPGILTYFWILLIWIVRARALIIHMSIPCDKIFPTVLNPLTLTFDKFFLKLTLVMTSKIWILELPYCICLFPVTRSFYWYQNICPCDLGHLWNWQLLVAFMFHKHILFVLEVYSVQVSYIWQGAFSSRFPMSILVCVFFGFVWMYGLERPDPESIPYYGFGVLCFCLNTVITTLARPHFIVGQCHLFNRLRVNHLLIEC